jgi:fatty-acyl-CoA synthase
MACIILKDGLEASDALKDEIKEFTIARIAKHKVPRYIDFVTEFPMNAAGKILKYKMRETAVEKLNLQAADKIVTA